MMAISMSGLDLSFMKNPKNRLKKEKVKRVKPAPSKRSTIFGNGTVGFLPDLDVAYNGGFESPIDGTFITSRSQLREHNIRHDVIQAGEIYGKTKGMMKQHMRWNPEGRSANGFSWTERPAARTSNLSEI